MLNLFVNNATYTAAQGCNLTQLISLTGFADQRIAVAINGEFIPKSAYLSTELSNGDAVDIVKPIGGG